MLIKNINPKDYLIIPDSNIVIAEYEPDWTKGFNYENAHKEVLKKGLQVPAPRIFMKHFTNVIDAYNKNSKLYTALGNEVKDGRLESLYKYLTSVFNNGAWSWLNGKFVLGSGFNNLDLETIAGLDSNGNPTTKREPLEVCLMENCYVGLKFNNQGLAVKKSDQQKCIQGKNIYFLHPRENTVARFVSGSSWSGLNCYGAPFVSDALLGVFASAEGASQKI